MLTPREPPRHAATTKSWVETVTIGLFDDVRLVPSYELPATASAWDRLARAEGAVAHCVRSTLQNWWAAMPADARSQIRERLGREDVGAHLGAFWEIYLHRLFSGLGFEVEIDIGGDDQQRRHPDFRLLGAFPTFRVEGAVVLGEDAVERRARARVQQLYAAIERVRNRKFLLGLDLRAVGPATPGASLVAVLDRWLDGLDQDGELARIAAGGEPAGRMITHAGWRVRVTAFPWKPHLRGRGDLRIIGEKREGWQVHRLVGERTVEFEGFKAFDEVGPLTKKPRDKAGHGYELDGERFVIAALCGGIFAADREMAQALLGRAADEVGSGAGSWQGGGLWLDKRCAPPRNAHGSSRATTHAR